MTIMLPDEEVALACEVWGNPNQHLDSEPDDDDNTESGLDEDDGQVDL